MQKQRVGGRSSRSSANRREVARKLDMSSAAEAKQERDWQTLHDAITAILDQFGRKDAFGEGDYWLVDDNWGRRSHQIEFQNLEMFKPHIVKALQDLLAPYPDWYIEI